jgi:hypothetical protein
LIFLDIVPFLPYSLRKLPESFGLTDSKSWNPHYFNTKENMHYVGQMPDTRFYGANYMGELESKDFMEWYKSRKS